MKRWSAPLVLLIIAAAIGVTSAQPTSVAQQVIATDEARMAALRRGDPAPLERIYADDYTLVTSLGQVRSKADQIAELKSGSLQYTDIRSVDRQVRLYGDVAVIVSRQRAEITQGGRRITNGDERVTRVYKNFNGQWKVIVTHATTIR